MLYLEQAARGVFIPRKKQRELSSAVFIDNLSQGWKGLDGAAVAFCASGGGRIEADPLTGDPTGRTRTNDACGYSPCADNKGREFPHAVHARSRLEV